MESVPLMGHEEETETETEVSNTSSSMLVSYRWSVRLPNEVHTLCALAIKCTKTPLFLSIATLPCGTAIGSTLIMDRQLISQTLHPRTRLQDQVAKHTMLQAYVHHWLHVMCFFAPPLPPLGTIAMHRPSSRVSRYQLTQMQWPLIWIRSRSVVHHDSTHQTRLTSSRCHQCHTRGRPICQAISSHHRRLAKRWLLERPADRHD